MTSRSSPRISSASAPASEGAPGQQRRRLRRGRARREGQVLIAPQGGGLRSVGRNEVSRRLLGVLGATLGLGRRLCAAGVGRQEDGSGEVRTVLPSVPGARRSAGRPDSGAGRADRGESELRRAPQRFRQPAGRAAVSERGARGVSKGAEARSELLPRGLQPRDDRGDGGQRRGRRCPPTKRRSTGAAAFRRRTSGSGHLYEMLARNDEAIAEYARAIWIDSAMRDPRFESSRRRVAADRPGFARELRARSGARGRSRSRPCTSSRRFRSRWRRSAARRDDVAADDAGPQTIETARSAPQRGKPGAGRPAPAAPRRPRGRPSGPAAPTSFPGPRRPSRRPHRRPFPPRRRPRPSRSPNPR